jgi:hypothetical protein
VACAVCKLLTACLADGILIADTLQQRSRAFVTVAYTAHSAVAPGKSKTGGIVVALGVGMQPYQARIQGAIRCWLPLWHLRALQTHRYQLLCPQHIT